MAAADNMKKKMLKMLSWAGIWTHGLIWEAITWEGDNVLLYKRNIANFAY